MTKAKILITGAGGYIGSNTVYLFLQKGFEVVGLDNFNTGFEAPLKLLADKFGTDKFRYYKADIREDLSKIFDKEPDIAAVVHFAGLIVVNESMQHPQIYFENNVCGSLNLFSSLVDHGIKRAVFSSTAAVYDAIEKMPIKETDQVKPANPYGESKLMVEKILGWYGQLLDFKSVIFRYFNVCGASDDGLLGYSKTPSTHLVQNAVKGALGIEPFYLTCPKVATSDGTPIRDYINVVDLAQAHLKAVEYLLNGGESETINLGTQTGNSVLEIVEKVQQITGTKFEVEQSSPRQGEVPRLVASVEKAQQILGWKPERSIEQSIQATVAWYKIHPKGWNS